MSGQVDSLTAARLRVRAAYDPQLVLEAGQRLAPLLADHLRRVQNSETVVLPWVDPRQNVDDARLQTPFPVASSAPQPGAVPVFPHPAEVAEHFARFAQTILDHGINLHDPRYIGHQVPPPIPLSGLFDAIGAVTNQPMAVYEMGPWATAAEQVMMNELARYIGWEGRDYGAILTHGASIANLTALLVARNVVLGESWEAGVSHEGPAPVIVVQAEAHYCMARAAGVLGLGTHNVIKVPLDDRRRMDPAQLDPLLARLRQERRPIVAVVASACSTPIGAFDQLDPIADICERHGVWLHVDAAHGGAALLSPTHRHLLAGLERADSLTWDAHKMLFVPALCAFLFYKQKHHSYEAFKQNAPYLFDPADPGLADYDGGLRTLECTKRAAALGLWGVWSLFGPQLFTDLVDVTFATARQLYEKLEAASDFEALHEPQCNIVAFRHVPEALQGVSLECLSDFQRQLRRTVIESGEFYLVPTTHNGAAALRCTVMNPLTTAEHLDQLLDALRKHGQVILQRKR